jgi:hypothetical protein
MSRTLGDYIFTVICYTVVLFFLIFYITVGRLYLVVMSSQQDPQRPRLPASTTWDTDNHDPSEPLINDLADLWRYEQARSNTERRAACLLLEAPVPKPTIGKSAPKLKSKRTTISNLPGEIIENIVSYLLPSNKVTVITLALANRYMYSMIRSVIGTIPKFYENPNNCPACRAKKERVLTHLRWMWRPESQRELRQDVFALARYGLDRSHHFHREYEVLLRMLVRDGWSVRKRFNGYTGVASGWGVG